MPPAPVLDLAWTQAMELAWDSFRASTTPVGAVVVDGSGTVVATGRGRRYEAAGPPDELAGSRTSWPRCGPGCPS
jgi:hypothetical protein